MQADRGPRTDGVERATGIRHEFPLARLRAVVFDMDGVVTQTVGFEARVLPEGAASEPPGWETWSSS